MPINGSLKGKTEISLWVAGIGVPRGWTSEENKIFFGVVYPWKKVVIEADGKIVVSKKKIKLLPTSKLPMVVGQGQGNALRSIRDIAMLMLY